ncbi:MAG TPA: glycoside hydrolase family 3 N-terminal domain-containing protein [Candidatus Limnocylindria bacterium]
MTARGPSSVGRRALRAALTVAVLAVSAAQPVLAVPRPIPHVPPGAAPTTAAVPMSNLIGQKLVVAMQGTVASEDLLGRIEHGEVGGVILFGANIRSARQLAHLTHQLRTAASTGGQPPLLITTDQEGGLVKRLPWAPPTLSPSQMGAIGSAGTAFAQGKATAHVLACAGVNGNLAPVADVPASTASFLYQQVRTWSFDASETASLADAFASGVEAGANVPAMKHFPGLGRAAKNTDTSVVTIKASAADLWPGLTPYRTAIGNGIPMIMLSNATYTAYDRFRAAGWSNAISVGLLRETLGFTGVSITDSLNGTAAARGVSPTSLAIKAAYAGTDMILLTGPESQSKATYQALLAAAQAGDLPMVRLQRSYDRILAMKAHFPAHVTDSNPPNEAAPRSGLLAGGTLGGTTTAVRTSWSATDGCRISAYALERRTGSGSSAAQALSPSTATSIVQALRFGIRYRYGVTATDGAGNDSPQVLGASFRATRTQEASASVHFQGAWQLASDPTASANQFAYSRTAGAKASFSFTGSSVSWVAIRGPSRGRASVFVDGMFAGKVDLHATHRETRQVVFATGWAASGAHRITIVNRSAPAHPLVDLDAFVTLFPA